MFYNDSMLTRKGALANVWLAAHWEKRLSKAQIISTNIETSVKEIVTGQMPTMALRLSGQLLLGVTKIYGRKTGYLLEDCVDALSRLRLSFKNASLDMPVHAAKASHSAITIPTANNFDDVLAPEPELDLDALLRETAEAPVKSQNNRRVDLDAFTVNQSPITLLPLQEEMLPMSEIEIGRRATMDGIGLDSPLRPSIEVGRRAESPRSNSLPFSPLRTPTKPVSAIDFDDDIPPMIMNDEMYNDFLPEQLTEEAKQRESIDGRFSDPPAVTLKAQRGSSAAASRSRRIGASMRPLPLDDSTEIPQNLMQEYIKDTNSILLPRIEEQLDEEQFMFDSLNVFSIGNSTLIKSPTALDDVNNIIPMEADWNDNVMDIPMAPIEDNLPRSPKSPRLMSEHEVENGVPSIPPSPSKSVRSDRSSSASFTETGLSKWQRVLQQQSATSFTASLPHSSRRRAVAEAFYQVLFLHTKGLLNAEQSTPYGDIMLTAKPSLYEIEQLSFI